MSMKLADVKNLESVRDICFNEDIIKALEKFKSKGIKFKMIYSDPDYNVNISYNGIKYKKKWDEYMDWYGRLSRLSLDCLEDDGHLFLLNYPKQNSHLRVKYLEDKPVNIPKSTSSYELIKSGDINEYVWIYNSNVGMSSRKFTTAHRSILHITKSKKAQLNKGNWWMPYKNPRPVANKMQKKLIAKGISPETARDISEDHISNNGRMPYSWINQNELETSKFYDEGRGSMYHDLVKNYSLDKTIHPCQIPVKLVRGLIQSSTNQQDHVFIHFGGSGNELIECNNINRYFTSCEISKDYFKMICDRLKDDKKILKKKYKLMKSGIGTKSKKYE